MLSNEMCGPEEELLMFINNQYKEEGVPGYNAILWNRYYKERPELAEDPKYKGDYIGAHIDDDRGLGSRDVIAISYGDNRKFRIRDKITGNVVNEVLTRSNQIIGMHGEFQKEFTHEIPIQKKKIIPENPVESDMINVRYSATFRYHNK